jgi:U3 small nucleolar ribonucleoprotein component
MSRFDCFINDKPVPSEWEIAVIYGEHISVLRMRQADNSIKYKVSNGSNSFALNVETEHFDYESMPSNREENHAQLYRYDDFDKAVAAACRVAKIIKAEMEERRERMLQKQKGDLCSKCGSELRADDKDCVNCEQENGSDT